MAISYPLSLPSAPSPIRVEWRTASAVGLPTSPFTFKQQTQVFSGQMWEVDITLPLMQRAQADEWIAFFLKLNGREGTFLFGDPWATAPRGVATGTPRINGGSQVGQSLVTDGWSASTTAILRAGDWISFDNRLYKVLTTVNSNGSGQATLDIFPALRSSPLDNTIITTTNCKGLFRLSDNLRGLTGQGGPKDLGHYTMGFSAIEAI